MKASKDELITRMKTEIFPLVVKSLENSRYVDYSFQKKVLTELADSKGYYTPKEHIVLSVEFDATTCGIPLDNCVGQDDCKNCYYNPLNQLFDLPSNGEPLIITSRYTVNTLLDALALLSTANINSLLQLDNMKNSCF
jgi:hypothetical protein